MPQSTIPLKLMTWNLYLGGEIGRVIDARPALLPMRSRQLWEMVQKTDFNERVKAIADQISAEKPDVLALQEVFTWTLIRKRGLMAPQEETVYDFLPTLMQALQERGCPYFVVVHSPGANLVLPLEEQLDVRLEDSVALLLRVQPEGSPLASLQWENARQARFTKNLKADMDGEPFYISRGWAGVDLRQGECLLRVVTTHMEYFDEEVRAQQSDELLKVACGVHGPRIVLGDFNSRPDSAVAQTFANYGYKDAWIEAHPKGLATYSSGQDEDLRNPGDRNNERLDWVLLRGPIKLNAIRQVGSSTQSKTGSGMWASDHMGLVAEVEVTFDERRVRPVAEAPADEGVEVVRLLFDRFIKLDIKGMIELFHSDARIVFPGDPKILPWAGEFRGAGFTRFAQCIKDNIKYYDYRMKDIWGSGDRIVATSRERCLLLKNNRIFEHDLVALIRVENGKVTEFIEFSDTGLMERAVQAPPADKPTQVY